MKHVLKRALWVLLPGIFVMFGSCSDDKTATVAPPVVSFPVTDAEMEVDVEEEITFKAVVENDEEADCIWYVNGVVAASTPTMAYTFAQVGLYTVRCEVYNGGGRVAKVYKVKVNGIPLEVEFSESGNALSCDQGDEVHITATVVGGDKEVKHSWSIDGAVVSETADFTYTFMDAGTFTLAYAGANAYKMTAAKSWTIQVAEVEMPLTIEFSPAPKTSIRCETGSSVKIGTDVKYGGNGLVHVWTVDGAKVSDDAMFEYTFTHPGTYAVAYEGRNTEQETVTASWTVEATYLFADFEGLAALPADIEDSNKALSLVENPFKTATNASATVLMNKLGGWTTSGMFKLLLSDVSNPEQYSTLRVKIYLGTNLYYPYIYFADYALPVTVNGETYKSQEEWRKIVRTDDWNVLVYDLSTNLGAAVELQFRPLSNWDHSNFIYTGDPATDNRTVYFDDIEFLK